MICKTFPQALIFAYLYDDMVCIKLINNPKYQAPRMSYLNG